MSAIDDRSEDRLIEAERRSFRFSGEVRSSKTGVMAL
jgi:hypothetical protein